jgi:hypothetical protein
MIKTREKEENGQNDPKGKVLLATGTFYIRRKI